MDDGERATTQRELVEEFGLLHEQMGGTRMTGRVSGWLLLCRPPRQSLTEIAEVLGVSKAAVSGAARLLVQARIIERVSEPGQRGDFYQAIPRDAASVLPVDHVHALHDLLVRSLATVADRDPAQANYALMRDMAELTAFIEAELPGLLARWHGRRAVTATPSDPTGRTDSTLPPGGAT
jgi:hypothetical protein